MEEKFENLHLSNLWHITQRMSTTSSSIDDLRQQGNYAFSQGDYDTAVSLYSAAISEIEAQRAESTTHEGEAQSLEGNVSLNTALQLNLCNRSACYYQIEDYDAARQDADLAWKLSQKQNLKAAYRLCKALIGLKEYNQAKETIQLALAQLNEVPEQQSQSEAPKQADADFQGESADQDTEKAKAMQGRAADSAVGGVTTSTASSGSTGTTTSTTATASNKKLFQDLWNQILTQNYSKDLETPPELSIKYVKRGISIKEFDRDKASLGYGNFSEIVAVTHKQTGERFALKIIEKKQAADLAKRQHPNVYNEIQMERRVLLERLPQHRFIVTMYHAFQDYNNLYYLMDLHTKWSDLWSELRYTTTSCSPGRQKEQTFMVGCHRSQARIWMYQLVDALEHMHKHGIVHRDLKPENILLTGRGHIVVIDFGTAKDLIETDLNGPEFVGTPDFMSPEAVQDGKLMILGTADSKEQDHPAVHSADLFTFGGIIYSLHTGMTPFWSPSPYLTFLRIKRCNLLRTKGIVDDDAWDLIEKLMKLDPKERLGADAFHIRDGVPRRVICHPEDGSSRPYDCIRNHPYFAACREEKARLIYRETPIPTLEDLCIRQVAELAYKDSLDIDLCDKHPPGDGSSHDMMRLHPRARDCVMHVLDRLKLLRDPGVYARFFTDPVRARLDKVRPITRDYVGLTRMNDDEGKPPKARMNDQYATPVAVEEITVTQITNPLFVESLNKSATEETRKLWVKLLKRCIATINRTRPRLVVASGYVDDKCRKLLARVSDSIPVVVHDGSAFFSFWFMGMQCMALQCKADANKEDSEQTIWLREQLEQVRLSKHPLFVFCNGDPLDLPTMVLKRLARGRTLGLYGVTEKEAFATQISYQANEKVNDNVSVQSDESDEDNERDSFMMKVKASHENGLRTITVDEEPDKWMEQFQRVDLEPTAKE